MLASDSYWTPYNVGMFQSLLTESTQTQENKLLHRPNPVLSIESMTCDDNRTRREPKETQEKPGKTREKPDSTRLSPLQSNPATTP